MPESPITKWLKRLFSLNSLGFIVAIIGVLVAYKQLMREDGGMLTIDVNGEQSATDVRADYIVCTGTETLFTRDLAFFPKYDNDTKYAVKEMLLSGIIESDSTLTAYLDNTWTYRYNDGQGQLRYEDTRVFPHTGVPFPFSRIQIKSDGNFNLFCRATNEGSEKPLEFTLCVYFLKVPEYRGEDFDTWRQRARRRLASSGVSGRPVIYIAHNRTLRIEADGIASETAELTRPKTSKPSTAQLPPAGTVFSRNSGSGLIENLEDVKFEKTGTYSGPIANFTFKAPGQKGWAIAVIGYKQGSDTIDVPWYRRFFKRNYYAASRTCWIRVSDTTTHYSHKYKSPIPNAELLGFAKVNPERQKNIIFRNDSIVNTSDKAALVVYMYVGTNRDGSSWASAVEGHSRNTVPKLEMGADQYNILYCDIPDAKFSKRHHTVWVTLSVFIFILMILSLMACMYAVDDDSEIKLSGRIILLVTAIALTGLLFYLHSNFDIIV